ncbi:MAG: GNAT family N-acetyltransferase [Tissierellia bacterium]|nr:GNAT family N-acetyltransferase [Tissierellia bacterium]
MLKLKLKGERITIAPLKLEDVYFLKEWGVHENPLLGDYNLPHLTTEELERWYHRKIRNNNNKYFGIFNEENRFIGYMGIKNIRKILKDSVLGIVIDPNYVNRGYGTEAIVTFLDYYFNVMNMKKLYLEVAKFNKRAIRCYEKCGFKIVDSYLGEFHDQYIDKNNPYYLREESSFVIIDEKIYNYIYKMKVDKKSYLKERDKLGAYNNKDKIRPIT